jgi:hypothetical protein
MQFIGAKRGRLCCIVTVTEGDKTEHQPETKARYLRFNAE